MGTYIGNISVRPHSSNEKLKYINFYLLEELHNGNIVDLSSYDIEHILPNAEHKSITLYSDWDSDEQQKEMNKLFTDKSLWIIDFELSDLSRNSNDTDYMIYAIDTYRSGKLRRLYTENIFHIIDNIKLSGISGNRDDGIINIEDPTITHEDQVILRNDNFWGGPYVVHESEEYGKHIKLKIAADKYTINGYDCHEGKPIIIEKYDASRGRPDIWNLVQINQDANAKQIDLITDEELLEEFSRIINNENHSDGKIDIETLPQILKEYNSSLISGSIITEENRENRVNRLFNILSSEKDITETLKQLTRSICDLLVKHQNEQSVNDWTQKLISNNPTLIENLTKTRTISDEIERRETQLKELEKKIDIINHDIKDKIAEAERVNEAAIIEKKNELLNMDEKYNNIKSDLENKLSSLGLVNEIIELKSEKRRLEDDIQYEKRRQNDLIKETNELERKASDIKDEFNRIIRDSHDQMVEIAFDGFMSSKMLNAATEWESEENIKKHEQAVDLMNSADADEFSSDSLRSYIYDSIRIVRPTYSWNTIMNIMICVSQGFLTVFSGDPGCGKTSICNILGDVLGLNLIGKAIDPTSTSSERLDRFLAVSIERGWTSKRDFIGYYNPLSKSFDKSNRAMYDALRQLHTEKTKGESKFPYFVLLDEANLSPMEYYWSDFMNICDDLNDQSSVNLGRIMYSAFLKRFIFLQL